ncbi:peptide ABC transporter permease [Paramesorhizobium deserti]|uniref:Peptide ABC transporter permease n=1 Tax=Paramesorhizobium deserti TaxID=1494590 RepID=A0A135HQ62_9HYPH|nr:peptide ABC transporter permease [Paramesorhizobium deserti]KXF75339.1 peptide ABC transporter permease [Paramesorhizobium deserti]
MVKDKDPEQFTYSGEKARQGEIILRTRTRRIIFIAGLAGILLFALILRFAL